MAVFLEELTIEQTLAASAGDIIEAGEASSVFIGSAVFTNSNAGIETVTVWRITSSGTSSASNYLAKKDILPGKSWICQELAGQVINNGSRIQASSSSGGVVNANLSGTVSN